MSKKVLIIDDEEDIQTYLNSLLTNNGYETQIAEDGVKGLETAKTFKPDLIILDIIMPNQSGVGFYRNIKKDNDLKDTPIIVLSGVTRYKEFFGTDHRTMPQPQEFIEKPFDSDDLLSKIKSHI